MHCVDIRNRVVLPGLHFLPGPDPCTLCVCDNGNPKWCKAVLCSPPQNCKSFRIGSSCCDFICLDETLGKSDAEQDITAELGLRLIFTAITAILSLSFLFFLLHRLRQRKIRGRQDRELTEEERSLGSIGYIAGSLGYISEHPFEENGQVYPLWKPSFYPRGEAPPPYEEALAAARAEAALARIPGPSIPSQVQSHHRTIPASVGMNENLDMPSPVAVQPLPTPYELAHVETVKGNVDGEEERGVIEVGRTGGDESDDITTEPRKEGSDQLTIEPRKEGVEEADDYRSECENCNMRQAPAYEEDLVTMTLHRRTAESNDLHFFQRTSLTLPTHPRKQQQRCSGGLENGVRISCARENWFSSMPPSSSSEEDEQEEGEEE